MLKKLGIGLSDEEKEVLREKKLSKLKYQLEVAEEKAHIEKQKTEIAMLRAEAKKARPEGTGFLGGLGFDPSGQGGKDFKDKK